MRVLLSVALFSSLIACTGLFGSSEPPPSPEIVVAHTGGGTWTGVLIEAGGEPCLFEEVAPGSRIVVKDGACTVTAPPPPAPSATATAEPAGPPPLTGWAKVAGVGPAKTLRVHNDEDRDWTSCTITVDGTYKFRVSQLKRLATDATPYGKFKDGSGNGMPASQSPTSVAVVCDQGVGYFAPGY